MTDQEMVERYGVVLADEEAEAPTLEVVMSRIMEAARKTRMEQIIQDGHYDPIEHGLEGRAGFQGRGTFVGANRKAGYRR